MKDNKKIGKQIENYARKNIPERQKEYGEFMYHAELIKRGHWDIHYQDLETMKPEYQEIIMGLCSKDEKDFFNIIMEGDTYA